MSNNGTLVTTTVSRTPYLARVRSGRRVLARSFPTRAEAIRWALAKARRSPGALWHVEGPA